MGLKKYRPITPGLRFKKTLTFEEITKSKPEKNLTKIIKKTGGRNNIGRVTNKLIGGGSKRRYRFIDFKRDKFEIPGKVFSIEYDPNRSANIALLHYVDGEKKYILASEGMKPGDEVIAGENVPVKLGNSLPLKNIPVGIEIHNIELTKGKGGQIVRSAGSSAQIFAKEGNWCHIKMPSGEVRLFSPDCMATIGQVSNSDWSSHQFSKAGQKRLRGVRPTVRGVAQNPSSHPHGGGEGRSGIGMKAPKTPWGKRTLGVRTRKKKKYSGKLIIKRRK